MNCYNGTTGHYEVTVAKKRMKKQYDPGAELGEVGYILFDARRRFAQVWTQFVHNTEPLDWDTHWKVTEHYTAMCLDTTASRRPEEWVELGANEIFRLEAVNDSEFEFETLLRFALNWAEVVGEIYTALDEVVEGYGDDGYSDLCDSLPFAGRAFCERCLMSQTSKPRAGIQAEPFKSGAEFDEALNALPKKIQKLVRGENYTDSTLEKLARRWVIYKLSELGMDTGRDRHAMDAGFSDIDHEEEEEQGISDDADE